MDYQTYHITWNNIPIEIRYNPNYSNAHKSAYGYGLAHVVVEASVPLPITSTGYKSQFLAEPLVAEFEDVTQLVITLLDIASNTKEWKEQESSQRQLNLF